MPGDWHAPSLASDEVKEIGRINADMTRKYVADIDNSVFYICGSTEMAEDVKSIVKGLGVSQENIKKEEFTGY